jgi:hypothetical protein
MTITFVHYVALLSIGLTCIRYILCFPTFVRFPVHVFKSLFFLVFWFNTTFVRCTIHVHCSAPRYCNILMFLIHTTFVTCTIHLHCFAPLCCNKIMFSINVIYKLLFSNAFERYAMHVCHYITLSCNIKMLSNNVHFTFVF